MCAFGAFRVQKIIQSSSESSPIDCAIGHRTLDSWPHSAIARPGRTAPLPLTHRQERERRLWRGRCRAAGRHQMCPSWRFAASC
jgi:hypothetical protein